MQRRVTTFAITGALLALAGLAPSANACKIPGITPMRVPVIVPPAPFPPAPGAGSAGAANTSIVGLWNVTFYSGGGVVDQAFDSWQSGGAETLNDYTNPIEDNVCLGVWTQTGPQTYQLKHPSWTFDDSGNLTGTAWFLETDTVGPNGNEYEGSYSIYLFDTAGNPVGSFSGGLKAYRINPN